MTAATRRTVLVGSLPGGKAEEAMTAAMDVVGDPLAHHPVDVAAACGLGRRTPTQAHTTLAALTT